MIDIKTLQSFAEATDTSLALLYSLRQKQRDMGVQDIITDQMLTASIRPLTELDARFKLLAANHPDAAVDNDPPEGG